ncbi:MAG: protein arginine kinase [Clostridia bacterium]|nr:protein arginine kinase [Clostridia bacterium]
MSCWYKDYDALGGIVISSRIRLARNLSNMPFPRRMDAQMLRTLKERVKVAVDKMQDKVMLKFIEMNDIPENEIKAMVERHVISPDFANSCRDRAIALSNDENISIMIGEEDHIRIQVISAGNSLDKAYEIADMIDVALNESLGFAFDSKLGYLTECPTNIGTGLRASLMLHLPVCESRGEINMISDAASKIGLTVRGMYGEGSKASASFYQISNQITLGISEKNAIENLKVIAQQIVEREKSARADIDKLNLMDTVFRSLGALKYARIMSSDEFTKHISMIKLGVDEGIIENNNIKPVELLISAQPYMLMKNHIAITPLERDEARATMIRGLL